MLRLSGFVFPTFLSFLHEPSRTDSTVDQCPGEVRRVSSQTFKKRASQEAESKAKWRKEEKAKREAEISKRTIASWKSLIPKEATKLTEAETKVKAKIEAEDKEKELSKGPN